MKKITLFFLIIFFTTLYANNQLNLVIDSLNNGLKIYLIQDKTFPLVQVRIAITVGSSIDPENYDGITYLTAQMLLKGTEKKTSQEIAEEFEFLGSSINVTTDYDYTLLSSEFLKYNFKNGLEILSEISTKPTFPSDEFYKLQNKHIGELRSSLENSNFVSNEFFKKIIFNNLSYSRNPKGTIKSVSNLSVRNIRNHYKKNFLPNLTSIIIYGDIDTSSVITLIKEYFSQWKRGNINLKRNSNISPIHSKVILIDKPGLTQSQIRIGKLAFSKNFPDELPTLLANTILGDGFTSRLVTELRVKNSLTYGVSSKFNLYKDGGYFVISTFTKNSTTGKTIEISLKELEKFHNNLISVKEFQKAKNYMIGEFSRDFQSPSSIINKITEAIIYQIKFEDYLNNYIDKIKNTKISEIEDVIRKYFSKDDVVILVVGDKKEIKNQLEKFGDVLEIYYENLIMN